jgi:DNA-binding transcriptional LysR family regulator
MVHTRDLRYFLAVVDHLHFTRAAASLYITQPALSKQIASLERTLDVQLFTRRHEGVALTPAGQALLPHARRMVELEVQAVSEVRTAATAPQSLTIGFWVSPANDVLARTVATFSARHEGTRLRLRRAAWSEHGVGVETHQADVGLVWTGHDLPAKGLRTHRLAVEEIRLGVPDWHPLAARDWVTPHDLAEETLFVLPDDGGPVSRKSRLDGFGCSLRSRDVVTTIDEVVNGIGNGLGVCVFTDSLAAAHPHPRVVTVPMRDVEPADYCIVWRREDEGRPVIQDLVQALVDAWDEVAHRGSERAGATTGA